MITASLGSLADRAIRSIGERLARRGFPGSGPHAPARRGRDRCPLLSPAGAPDGEPPERPRPPRDARSRKPRAHAGDLGRLQRLLRDAVVRTAQASARAREGAGASSSQGRAVRRPPEATAGPGAGSHGRASSAPVCMRRRGGAFAYAGPGFLPLTGYGSLDEPWRAADFFRARRARGGA